MPKPPKGRIVVLFWIGVFLITAGTIALRNQAAFQARKRMGPLEDSLQAVVRIHTQMSADLAVILAPANLRPLGESLGLRSPSDSESVDIQVRGN